MYYGSPNIFFYFIIHNLWHQLRPDGCSKHNHDNNRKLLLKTTKRIYIFTRPVEKPDIWLEAHIHDILPYCIIDDIMLSLFYHCPVTSSEYMKGYQYHHQHMSKKQTKEIVLHAILMSGNDFGFPESRNTWCTCHACRIPQSWFFLIISWSFV
jgi:hypothetical protein